MSNPFKKGSKQYLDYEKLSDLNYHCSKCELKTSQGGKTFNTWINEKGINMKKPIKKYCPICNDKEIFRALENLEINELTKKRKSISTKDANKIKKLLENRDSINYKILSSSESEIDHRIPQIRWTTDELDISSLTDSELKDKFQLLTRSENLTKSRCCEKCVKTNKRQSNPYISGDYFYKGAVDYDEKIGCDGCFWFNPDKWLSYYKEIIKKE